MESENAPIRRIAGTLLTYALKDRAQEIRIHPLAGSVVVHYRINEEWVEQMKIPAHVLSQLSSYFAELAKLKGNTPENPKQGTFDIQLKDTNLDVLFTIPVQVRIYPVEYGQQIHPQFRSA